MRKEPTLQEYINSQSRPTPPVLSSLSHTTYFWSEPPEEEFSNAASEVVPANTFAPIKAAAGWLQRNTFHVLKWVIFSSSLFLTYDSILSGFDLNVFASKLLNFR